jgi:lysyl endopeptidase
VLLVSQIVLGQVTNEATSRGWDLTFKSHPQKVIMPSIDLQALEQEDALMGQGLPKPYRFGKKKFLSILICLIQVSGQNWKMGAAYRG